MSRDRRVHHMMQWTVSGHDNKLCRLLQRHMIQDLMPIVL